MSLATLVSPQRIQVPTSITAFVGSPLWTLVNDGHTRILLKLILSHTFEASAVGRSFAADRPEKLPWKEQSKLRPKQRLGPGSLPERSERYY